MMNSNTTNESCTLSTPEDALKEASDTSHKESDNRYNLAKVILICYMVLIIFAFSSPLIIHKTIGLGEDKEPISKIVQILNAYMGALTGLTGLVGFVVGYCYKEQNGGKQ